MMEIAQLFESADSYSEYKTTFLRLIEATANTDELDSFILDSYINSPKKEKAWIELFIPQAINSGILASDIEVAGKPPSRPKNLLPGLGGTEPQTKLFVPPAPLNLPNMGGLKINS